jgi:hypothetical protein
MAREGLRRALLVPFFALGGSKARWFSFRPALPGPDAPDRLHVFNSFAADGKPCGPNRQLGSEHVKTSSYQQTRTRGRLTAPLGIMPGSRHNSESGEGRAERFPFEPHQDNAGALGAVPVFGIVLLNGIPAQDYATRVHAVCGTTACEILSPFGWRRWSRIIGRGASARHPRRAFWSSTTP